jgi:hypothetical protein
MSGGHGHDDHGYGSSKKSGGGGVVSAFGSVGAPAKQMSGIFGALFTGLFDGKSGGGGHHHH